MTTQLSHRNLQPPQAPFVDPNRGLSYEGYQFLLSLLSFAALQVPTAIVQTDLVATGATQATAAPITGGWTIFSTVPAGSGGLLDALQPGQSQTVFNQGANTVKIYPPPAFGIDALALNAPYSLGAGKMQIFNTISATKIVTTQLQVP